MVRRLSILLLLAPVLSTASTIGMGVDCVSVNYQSNQPGSLSCTGAYIQSRGTPTADASLTVNLALLSIKASGDGSTLGYCGSTYDASWQITITNGMGAGSFLPCISAAAGGWATGSARFGSISEYINENGGDMTIPCPTYASGESIPFVFGVPVTEQVHLGGGGGGNQMGGVAWGQLTGIAVYDLNGNVLSSAQVTIVDVTGVPEPSLFVPLTVALAIGFSLRRRFTRVS